MYTLIRFFALVMIVALALLALGCSQDSVDPEPEDLTSGARDAGSRPGESSLADLSLAPGDASLPLVDPSDASVPNWARQYVAKLTAAGVTVTGLTLGATAQLVYGTIGVAIAGTAISLPLWVVGGIIGAAGGSAILLYDWIDNMIASHTTTAEACDRNERP